MFELINKDTGEVIELSDGDLSTLEHALSSIAADCEHVAGITNNDIQRERFQQSAESYRKLRAKLQFI